jgi:PXPV repeat (3 copies)
LPVAIFGGGKARQNGEFAMNLKRVLMLAVFAAIALPGAAHAQVRFGVVIGGPVRPVFYRPGVRVAIGLPPLAIGIGGPVYVQPAPVVFAPAPVFVAAPPPAVVVQPQFVAQPQFINGYPVLPPQPVPIR